MRELSLSHQSHQGEVYTLVEDCFQKPVSSVKVSAFIFSKKHSLAPDAGGKLIV